GEKPAALSNDPETHYGLGVAYREMEMLNDAIAEFQKAARGLGKTHVRFIETCSLLACCFEDKGLPLVAAKWYRRAMDSPHLDRDSWLALQYHLGLVHEQAGHTGAALDHFLEVYSQNIDYRDVSEKVCHLQQRLD
ncbi:MAG TPA: hypothetical protein VN648_02335, partial [Candidatus Methylomirabilis sp.]|nr:hypothetical protein [Candidatus Methylomirabilis sp.]